MSMWSKEKATTFLVGVYTGPTILENSMYRNWIQVSSKTQTPKRYAYGHQNPHTGMFTVAFILVENWKQPKRPSTTESIHKLWYKHSLRYRKERKMHKQLPHATAGINLRLLPKEGRHTRSHTEFKKGESNLQC